MFFVSGNVSLYSRIHNTVQWKRKVRRVNIYKRLKGGYKENSLSSVVLSERRKERAQTETQGSPSEQEQTFLHSGGDQAWAQAAHSPHPQRYSKAIWPQPWATSSVSPCLSRGVGSEDLKRSLPTSTHSQQVSKTEKDGNILLCD